MRIGIDTTKIGYCAPVFSDDCFEYIPIPQFNVATTEKSTYGTLRARNSRYGEFLSDFMHEDRHRFINEESGDPCFYSIDEEGNPLFARDLTPHIDPEFETNTFGDFWMESGGRIPSDLRKGDYIFFYAGLSSYDADVYKSGRTWQRLKSHQRRNKCTFLIGFLEIQEIYDIVDENDILEHSSEIGNNAHYKFYEADPEIFRARNFPTVIIRGLDESRLLHKAVQLNKWSPHLGKYSPTDFGRSLGLVPMSGMRIMKWLDQGRCRDILRMVKMCK